MEDRVRAAHAAQDILDTQDMEITRIIRIAIADDHRITLEGLGTMLNAQPDLEVIGLAGDGAEAVHLAEKTPPDVFLMDVVMPSLGGIDATRIITRQHPNIKVIALSMHTDKKSVTGMIRAGASGYMLKNCSFQELLGGIYTVMSGKTYLDPGITSVVVHYYIKNLTGEDSFSSPKLTRREREVLQLIASGKRTKEIARKLKVSVKTIETHRRQLMGKLGIFSIAELTKYAIKEDLASL